jgi:ribosomal protein L24
VTSGKWKGQQGNVLKCLRATNQLVIEGVNVVPDPIFTHTLAPLPIRWCRSPDPLVRASQQSRLIKTGAEEKAALKTWESPVHYSNVSLVDPAEG